jgi:hypothetical protein
VQNPSKAQIFLTCSQNQKIFKTDFCLNLEFEHRINDSMTYIWKKHRISNERAQWAWKFVQNCQNPPFYSVVPHTILIFLIFLTKNQYSIKIKRFCTITDNKIPRTWWTNVKRSICQITIKDRKFSSYAFPAFFVRSLSPWYFIISYRTKPFDLDWILIFS